MFSVRNSPEFHKNKQLVVNIFEVEPMSSQPEEQSSRSCLETLLRRTLQTCRCLEDLGCAKNAPEAEKGELKRGYEKGLEKRFFSYGNWKGDRSLETRVAAFFL